ncbi:hypothetical protein [Blastococcus saxobsidens]|nr:hypothetical protein [Blastococcus saxobsidens]
MPVTDTSGTLPAGSGSLVRAGIDRHRTGRDPLHPPGSPALWHHRRMTDGSAFLVARLHIDLALVSSAACRAAR